MKIVFLDAYTTNPGDLSFDPIDVLGEFKAFDYSTKSEAIERGGDAEIIITNKHQICEERLSHWPKCKFIAVAATGYNNVDLDACNKNNILVSNVKGYSTDSVAQLTFASILNILNRVAYYNAQVKAGRWSKNRDFSFYDHSIRDLAALKLGVYGLGNIGTEIAKIGTAFNMEVYAVTKYPEKAPAAIHLVESEKLFGEGDIISINVPLTHQTKHLINHKTLKLMKPNAILVNTSRGQLIHEGDLEFHLKNNPEFHALLDVMNLEPPGKSNSLIGLNNCHITPHIGWASWDARKTLVYGIANNISRFMEGSPVNVVN